MASLSTSKDGRHRILYIDRHGERKAIRLGRVPIHTARSFLANVTPVIQAAKLGGEIPPKSQAWLAELDDRLYKRLVKLELAPARDKAAAVELGPFVTGYIAQRKDLKPTTHMVLHQARRHLTRFLGERRDITTVTPADADAFKASMMGEKRAKATVNKWCRLAREFFNVALRRKLIGENPFAHIKGAVVGDPRRRVFVPADVVRKVMEQAADPQWRLLIALARWGGLRVPSEPLALTWADIDFAGKRFIVRAPKTEHHAGGGVRVVPMFPELAPLFQAVFDAAPEGSTFVITRYRNTAANLRTQLCRYITAAGFTPWVRPWQNLRVSRATELADLYPSHVCAAWLGHSEKIADSFYRQVTDAHFQRATGANEPAEKAAQNVAHYAPKTGHNGPQADNDAPEKNADLLGNMAPCGSVQNRGLGDEGLEHPPKTPTKTHNAKKRGAESGAVGSELVNPNDIADVLRRLPMARRAEIVRAIAALLRDALADAPETDPEPPAGDFSKPR